MVPVIAEVFGDYRSQKMSYPGPTCSNLDEVCSVLGWPVAEFCYFANNVDKHVRLKVVRKKSGGPRITYAPRSRLKEIQRSIKTKFLDQYKYPEYIHGLSGDSLRDHASYHKGDKILLKLDLTDFFPNIEHRRVYKMWREEFGLPHDVSRLMTKIITYKGRLQQGFPTSSHAAAIIALPLTTQINEYCEANSIVFSQYVDDLNFSGTSINFKEIFKIIVSSAERTGFSIKRKKTKVTNPFNGKKITGVSVYGHRIRAAREIRKKAAYALQKYALDPDDKTKKQVLGGYLAYIKHINKKDGQRLRKKINKIKKR